MTCRHSKDDPNCSSNSYRYDYGSSSSSTTPDAEKFNIEDIEEVGNLLVVKVTYPNCRACAFEGQKVMVFENRSVKDAIKWKRIDPHFRKPVSVIVKTEAPTPVARFPASDQGWKDAMAYAISKAAKR